MLLLAGKEVENPHVGLIDVAFLLQEYYEQPLNEVFVYVF
jgi:hypothetical protein